MKFSALFLVIVLLACSKKQSFQAKIIGHAGNGLSNHQTFAHNNSLKSIEIALGTDGCAGVELDVQVSKDKTLWLFHEEKLDAVTNATGFVYEKSNSELSQINYSSKGKEKLVPLNEIPVDWLTGKTIFLDIKNYFEISENEFIETVYSLLNQFSAQNPSCEIKLVSHRADFLSEWNFSGVERFVELSQNELSNIDGIDLSQIDGVLIRYNISSKEIIQKIHSLNKKSAIYDLRAPKSIRKALETDVDFLISDDVTTAVIERN